MTLALLWACTCAPEPTVEPAPPGRVAEAAGLDLWTRAPLEPLFGEALVYEGYTVQPVSLQVFEDYRVSAALWLPDQEPVAGVLMAHGHFGQGKSSGEAQGPAHVLAANGYAVLAVDTPGVEEGDRPDRAIHFEAGAGNRGLLWAHGSSAMAVQLHGLQAGLDLLGQYAEHLVAAGSSGGAVQALYLLMVDPRPEVAVLASMVPVPREARASGCPCDVLPGWEGPDPALLASLDRPVLWMTETEGSPRPTGLPSGSDYQVHPGPHGFEAPMRSAALAFLAERYGGGERDFHPPNTPQDTLASPEVGGASLSALASSLPERPLLAPVRTPAPPWTVSCSGSGPRLLLLGPEEEDLAALQDFTLCALELRLDELGPTQGVVTGTPYADVLGAAIHAAAQGAPVYAVGAWAVPASRSGAVYVARDPLDRADEGDPAWVHLPGFWDHPRYTDALAVDPDPDVLAEALRKG